MIVTGDAILEIGDGFYANKNCILSIDKKTRIGDSVLFGWDVHIRTSDGHKILYHDNENVYDGQVIIENHVWICSETVILKGVHLKNDTIVGWGSLVIKSFDDSNILVAGHPAKLIKNNVSWEK